MEPRRDTLITLASASPQRRELLESLGFPLLIRPQDVDESPSGLAVADEVLRLARVKAESCQKTGAHSRWILGVDTALSIDGRFLGKPADRGEARRILGLLGGRSHLVVTGVALIDADSNRSRQQSVRTRVSFNPLSDTEIEWYLDSGEWRGAAGGYRIQARGGLFIRSLAGSYHNVVGLPIDTIYGMLKAFKYPFP
jgi:nucleoside triphosphate pyrophosphatase